MNNQRVCPVTMAGSLDNRFRRWLQNPQKLLKPYVKPGMTVMDIGCGPGFFTLEMARMTGPSGHVIAADIQEGMLQKVRNKITDTDLQDWIRLHQCQKNNIGITEQVDFILAFYMVHEVPDQEKFLLELHSILKPGGMLLIIEPIFHVTIKAFERMVETLEQCGFTKITRLKMILSSGILVSR